MSEEQAVEAARLVQGRFPGVYADPIDPRAFLTLSLDRWSAEAVLAGISLVANAGGDVGNLAEDFEDFLAYAYPYEEGESPWPGIP
jgi:hypothetical protein